MERLCCDVKDGLGSREGGEGVDNMRREGRGKGQSKKRWMVWPSLPPQVSTKLED